jgi:hypothetical protein
MLAIVATAPARLALADEAVPLAVVPVQNLAQLDDSEADYLSDVVRGAAANADPAGLSLVPQKKVIKAAGKKAAACDETCAARVGRKTGADRVVLCEVRRIGKELRATAKLLDRDGALVGMQRASGTDVAALERELERAVTALFRPPGSTPDQPAPPPIPQAEVSGAGDYYGELIVTTTGTREGDESNKPVSMKADVFVNGRKLGRTPLEDGLPAGTYLVEVKSGGRVLHSETIDLVGGRTSRVEARGVIPLTAAERAAAADARRQAYADEQAELAAAWDQIRTEWRAEDETVRARRRPYLIGGTVALIGGLGLAVSGITLEARAKREDEEAFSNYDKWQAATDPDEIERYESRMDEALRSRDISHGLGISFLAVGGAALVTGTVLFWLMPSRLEEPRPPPGLEGPAPFSLELLPLLGPDVAGMGVGGRFR